MSGDVIRDLLEKVAALTAGNEWFSVENDALRLQLAQVYKQRDRAWGNENRVFKENAELKAEIDRLQHITGEMEAEASLGRVVPVEKGMIPPWPGVWFQFWCNCVVDNPIETVDQWPAPIHLDMYLTQRLAKGPDEVRIFMARCPRCGTIYRAADKGERW